MYFPSKRDAWLGILLWGMVGVGFFLALRDLDIAGLYITVPLLLLAGWIWFFTGYTITDEELLVRCGPFRKRLPLKQIKRVKESRNPLASAALSMERLEIHTERRFPVIISPKDRDGFLDALQEKQAKIKVDSRKESPKGKKRPQKTKRRR